MTAAEMFRSLSGLSGVPASSHLAKINAKIALVGYNDSPSIVLPVTPTTTASPASTARIETRKQSIQVFVSETKVSVN